MYTVQTRYSRPLGRGYRVGQRTMSWRTGSSDLSLGNKQRLEMYTPRGTFVDALSERRLFLERQMAIASQSRLERAEKPYPERAFTHDAGHDFQTSKISLGGTFFYEMIGKYPVSRAPVGTFSLAVPVPTWAPYMPLTSSTTSSWTIFGRSPTPTTLERDGTVSQLFNWARPDDQLMGWGETVLSLLTGDIPGLVSNLYKRIEKNKQLTKGKIAGDLGSDYLNSVFGWQPILQDLTKLLRILVEGHNALYSASSRRVRTSPSVVLRGKESRNPSASLLVPWNDSRGYGFSSSLTSYGTFPVAATVSYTYEWNTRLSARFTNLRPSTKDNSFVDRGLALLHDLGFWTPSLGWDIIPFSWLVDWFISIGQGIQNVSTYGADGTYRTDYAYSTTLVESRATVLPGSASRTVKPSGSPAYTQNVDWNFCSTSFKMLDRRQGSPFGIKTLSSLSSSQFAILTALGLAKSFG